MNRAEIGQRIRMARVGKGLLQAELGRLRSRPVSHAAISDIERGKTQLNLEDVAEFARLLGKPVEFFLSDGPMVEYHAERPAPADSREALQEFMALARKRAAERQAQ